MKKILFVSFSKRGVNFYIDASARYRCIFPAEYLNAMGVNTHVAHFSQLAQITISDYSHIIFHRPQFSKKLKQVLMLAKTSNIQLLADVDDYLFSQQMNKMSPALLSSKSTSSLAQKQADSYRRALKLFSQVICSTEALSHQVRQLSPNAQIYTCFNKLPSRWQNSACIQPIEKRFSHKIIRYLPGTSHHQHDFNVIEKWLAALLHQNPDISLQIIGELSLNRELFPTKQLSQIDKVPFEELPAKMADSWLNLAPLQLNDFNHCKSGLKFWESGLMGIPVLASDLPDMHRFDNPGLLCSNNLEEWSGFIKKMQIFDEYAAASHSAYSHACNALFSPGNDCAYLNLFDIKVDQGLAEKRDISTQCTTLHYLVMAANCGTGWPLSLVNPWDKQHATALACEKSFSQGLVQRPNQADLVLNNLSPDEIINLELELQQLIASHSKVTKTRYEVFIRKCKKLINTPTLFFADSKLFKR